LIKAFHIEGYARRVAAAKPWLTPKHKADRVAWATLYKDWTWEDWVKVIWTDEASFKTGYHGQVFVTRNVEEKYLEDCLVPKFKKFSCWMVHGSISGKYKGPLVFVEKSWGNLCAQTYVTHILPHVHRFVRLVGYRHGWMSTLLMEDGASSHTARLTTAYHVYHGVNKMNWPANSPDLNPIENVWQILKRRVSLHFPTTELATREAIQLEWDRLLPVDYKNYILSMPERCKAVIASGGAQTRW
jgi:hypothetical protein